MTVNTRCSTTTTVSRAPATRRSILILALVASVAKPGHAYETDQFSNRLQPIADSTEVLNERVNRTLREVVEQWNGRRNDARFVTRVYRRIGGIHWVDRLERWAMDSDHVERLSTPRRDSIYSGHPFWATRVASLFGVGPTIKVNGVLIGSDKLGHFISQGRKFWLRYRNYDDLTRGIEGSVFTERALFGQLTTGTYSNADLVANYEGYLFYRSLFEDDVIPGKPAILAWQDGGWVIQRPFDFGDHVNDYWDEALNVNHFDALLYPHMKERLSGFCGMYEQAPESFEIENERALQRKYRHLHLRDTSELRLEELCVDSGAKGADYTGAAPESDAQSRLLRETE